MPAKSSFFKNAFYNSSLVLGSLLCVCVVFEVALRIANYNPFGEFFENEGRAVFIRPSKNPQRIFEAAPDTQGEGWGTHISINHHGFRGRDYSIEKPRDVYRIVVIGDSIAFGNNLPEDKSYPAVLEKLFTNQQRHVEVLNLALGGYDTLQEVATLNDIGLAFKPDLVILGYCINDIGIASGNLNYIKRLKNYGDPIYRLRLAQFIRIQLDRIELIEYEESANSTDSFEKTYKKSLADISLDHELIERMQKLSDQLDALPNEKKGKYFFTRDYTDSNHLRRLRFGLEQLKTLQKKNGFDIEVVITPYLLENQTSQAVYRTVYDIIEHEMTRLDFSTLNMYARFSEAGFGNIILKPNDGVHPNILGHEIIANTLYKKINFKQ